MSSPQADDTAADVVVLVGKNQSITEAPTQTSVLPLILPTAAASDFNLSIGYINVVINIISSIFLVVVNKWLFQKENWRYSVLILVLHAGFTKIMTLFLRSRSVFKVAEVPQIEVFKSSFAAVLSLSLMNLNLLHNPIGIFQLSKLLVIPATVLIQRVFYGITPSIVVLISLLFLIVGVAVATLSDVTLTAFGAVIAGLSVFAAAASSVLIEAKQKEFNLSPLQLIDQQALHAFVIVSFVSFFLEDIGSALTFPYTFRSIAILTTSGLLAGLLNISGFFVMGVLSPLTYHVSTHFKTLATLLFGIFVFGEMVTIVRWAGVIVGMFGMILYSVSRSSGLNVSVRELLANAKQSFGGFSNAKILIAVIALGTVSIFLYFFAAIDIM